MIKIEAVIRPTKLDDVMTALDELGISGMTVSHVMGSGKQRGRTLHYRGQEYTINLLDKIKLELFVQDKIAEKVIDTIAESASIGEIGDGKIFAWKIDQVMRIRTRETGEIALS